MIRYVQFRAKSRLTLRHVHATNAELILASTTQDAAGIIYHEVATQAVLMSCCAFEDYLGKTALDLARNRGFEEVLRC